MTNKEQLLMAITMLDESDCEYVLKILSGETRKDFEKKCDDWKTYKDCVIWQKNQSCLGCKFDE